MDDAGEELSVQEHIALAPLTTIGLGGEAKYFIACTTTAAIGAALDEAERRDVRVQILGGGSNLIFSDSGFDGLVLRISTTGIGWQDEGDTVLATVQAGERWDEFVLACLQHGYSGVECLSGIPGSVGATPIQNVGAYGQEVKDTIVSVTAMHRRTREAREFSNAECEFGYRESRFKSREKDQWIVMEVRFRLRKNGAPVIVYPELRRHLDTMHIGGAGAPQSAADAAATLLQVRDAVLALRRKKSMVIDPADPNTRSVGSFFMNPVLDHDAFARVKNEWERLHPELPIPSFPSGARVKVPAAWLIEHAGFAKGHTGAGGAGISANHTLALVNRGGTTCALLALATEIQDTVASVFGIRLEREAIVVG